ncbi:MAG TPA: lipase family protein [Nitrosarchaeum sp.]|nr:lipase family protein [Nitrosarchaeum sp.]
MAPPKSGLSVIFTSLQEGLKKVLKGCEIKNVTFKEIKEFTESFALTKKFNIHFNEYVDSRDKVSKILTEKRFFRLALYWSLWAYIAYEDPAVIRDFVTDKSNLKFYNTQSEETIQNPFFFLTADHLSRSIVIAVRGTAGIADGITDVLGVLVKFMPNEPEAKAHVGFAEAARNVISSVKEDLFALSNQFPTYPIKVVGHSYGAATSALVAYILNGTLSLRGEKLIKAVVYCCPATFNEYSSIKICVSGFVTSFILGWDAIPRASLYTGSRLLCKNADQLNVEEAHIPGNIFWITYDDNDKLEDMYLITSNNKGVQNIMMHPYMIDDHSMSRMVAALMVYASR